LNPINEAEQEAVDYAWAHGSLVIAAAGNEGDGNNRPMYPAACDGVVAVAATTWPDDYPASYSNFGYYLMVGAPAGDVSYVPLVRQILEFFRTGRSPVPADETLEIMAFMDAAERSRIQGGTPVRLAR
jgi:subtilisin family serine protease